MRNILLVLSALALAGCTTAKEEIGVPPKLSPVGYGINTDAPAAYQYPTPPRTPVKRFSLWDDRQSKLFADARALSAGDILTVNISINDRARFRNESERKRTGNRSLGVAANFGWGWAGTSGSADGEVNGETESKGTGATARSEDIRLSVAAVVTDVLPNGNLVISGTQEVLVNAEVRILTIAGIVRPMDIGPYNTISYERIAEARISYGGRGRLSEVQQPAYGHQVLDAVLPF
ncbi:flagellar basal body L-ring protein FlgH [Aquamicrobium sp. LC103]|uniref:flagellar basal body L-ring protein FlgH n=1 Tax=Aquamicrobium sp. LC103 TaxID=1120658 RepID=UPI00063ECD1B|nr:flagellar basal body L-ring protein FlgH [Aquamicrobium sp. LC103]TKT77486.1 flagellar basal body L-ring protein FlgH [Aquamicrobium sp. LC103]